MKSEYFTQENILVAMDKTFDLLLDTRRYVNRDYPHPGPLTAGTIYNVAKCALNVRDAGKKALAEGDAETALKTLGIADGALRLIAGLVNAPDHPIVIEMAAPFRPKCAVAA